MDDNLAAERRMDGAISIRELRRVRSKRDYAAES
jgi:hypothetical protein